MKTASLFALTTILLLGQVKTFANNSSLQSLEQQLFSSNPQIRSLESRVEAQKATAKSRIGNFLPEVSLIGGYEENKTTQEPSAGYLGYVNGAWNLFKGGEDYYLKEISDKEYIVAQLDLDIKGRSLRRQLREMYFQILANKKSLAVLDEKEEILKKQRQMAKKKINAGLTSDVDGIEIDLEENNILSERESITSEMTQLIQDLSAMLNTDIGEDVVSANEAFVLAQSNVNIEQALLSNPSVKRQTSLEDIAHSKVSQQRSEFIPRLDLEASYGRITPEYSNPAQGNESKVALLFTWNLFSGMSSYYTSKATSLESDSQTFEKKNTYLEIKKDLSNLATSRANLLKIKDIVKQRLTFTQKYYEMTLSEYKRGVKNSPDLQTATTSLYEAKRRMIEIDRDLSIVNSKIDELI